MQIFISYAHEDKDFVHPMADALHGGNIEVSIDRDFISATGGGLLGQISDRLSSCQYAVTVFSPAYFGPAKKWTREELEGLFALETRENKIIIPMRLGMSRQEVLKHSPIVGARNVIDGGLGVPATVAAIQAAVSTGERTREIGGAAVTARRVKELGETLKERNEAELLSQCSEGVQLVAVASTSVFASLKRWATESASEMLKLTVRSGHPHELYVYTGTLVAGHLTFRPYACNAVGETKICFDVFKLKPPDAFGERKAPTMISQDAFIPAFKRQGVTWCQSRNRESFSSDDLGEHLFNKLLTAVEKDSRSN